jgi:feruloyl esterase
MSPITGTSLRSFIMRSLPFIGGVLTLIVSLRYATAVRYDSQKHHGSFAARCSSIAHDFQDSNATVWFTQHVAAGTNLTFPDNDPTCARPSQLSSVELCRVALYVPTTNQSGISMEAWLPSNWTGRFLSTGNGGLSGCIQYEDMAYTTSLGFATVGANSGHNGTSGRPFIHNEDVIRDFAYRSVHTGTVVGKAITNRFYERQHGKSYYLGCSTGGRQGLRSAQSFPEDFDGILAGAPAVAFNNLSAWTGHWSGLTGPPGSDTFVPLDFWSTIHQDILDQCDGLDGIKDGIIEDPLKCNYDPSGLLCHSSSNTTGCLTAKQVATVKGTYSPVLDANGGFIYPRAQPGGEGLGAPYILYTGQTFVYATDWYKYAVYKDENFDANNLTTKDFDYGYIKNPGNSQSFEGNLAPFRKAGGKVLTYHGQADPLITSDISPIYYKHVQKTMGLGTNQMDDFYRLFRVSGMGHCSGGPGAWKIGQSGGVSKLDTDNNVLLALVQWVEKGKAPVSVTGTSDGGDTIRRHCKWPLTNKYIGGDVKNPASWKCQKQ